MKKIFSFILQIVLIAGCMVTYSSCGEDFLLKEPPAALAGSQLEGDIGVEGLLVGAYAHLTRGEIFGSAMGTDWVYASCAADDCYKGTTAGDQAPFNQVERYECLVDNDYMQQRWRDCYNGVSRCNNTLIFLKAAQEGSTPIAAARATQIEAETKYLRAWFHFAANRIFKNIPYIKTPDEQDGKSADEIPNTGPAWTEIEADLNFAINNLPESFPGEPGRVTKFAAITLLAQVKLYQGDYGAAAPLLDQVINSGRFRLMNNFWDNYDEGMENNEESIFELQCTTAASGQSGMRLVVAIQFNAGPAALGGWAFYQPTQSLVDAFQVNDQGLPFLDPKARPNFPHDMGITSNGTYPRGLMNDNDPDNIIAWSPVPHPDIMRNPWEVPVDLRLDWTVSRRGVDFIGWGIMGGQAYIREQANGGPWMTTKFMQMEQYNSRINGGKTNNDRNFRYHRYAHVLLWRAECYVEAGELEKARELVNMIRERAKNSNPVMGLCTVTNFTLTGALPADATVDWSSPAGTYRVEPYPAGHAAFSSQANARDAVRMEIRLEFATEGQRFFDLRRWGQFGPPAADGRPYDVSVLNDYIANDSEFRVFMRGTSYSERRRYWPVPQAQIDLQGGVITQDPDYM